MIYLESGGRKKKELDLPLNITSDDIELPLYDFPTITLATNNFSTENKLGEGGFGPVYKVCFRMTDLNSGGFFGDL